MPLVVNNENLYDTNLLLIVYSTRLGKKFECHRFREYNIDLDLDTDADAWDFVFKNPDSVYTSLFSKFDLVEIYIDGKGIVKGMVDTVRYTWNNSDSYIRVTGRDIIAPLVDNSAMPSTLQNVKPIDYIQGKCSEYSVGKCEIKDMALIPKIIIDPGESEISIINTMIKNENNKLWADYDTLHIGEWNEDAEPSYTFTSGVPVDKMAIPIISFELSEDVGDVYSEVIVYGSSGSGENKAMGSSKNPGMKAKRRLVTSASNNDGTDRYKANSEHDVRHGFDNSVELNISVKTRSTLIKPNTTAWVIDMKTRTNAVFFIKKVTYVKNAEDGGITKIVMIPSKSTNDKMYSSQGGLNGGITGKASMTFNELWDSKKG